VKPRLLPNITRSNSQSLLGKLAFSYFGQVAPRLPVVRHSDMQRTMEHTRADNAVSPATIELLIRERSKGKTLRQLGQMFGKSHERIRQLWPNMAPRLPADMQY